MPLAHSTVDAQALEGKPATEPQALQALSTRLAVLGSVAALSDALLQEPHAQRLSKLELAAAGLLASSLILEAYAYQRRRRVAALVAHDTADQGQAVPAAVAARRPWRPLLWMLLGLAVAMGAFTALGAGAAKRLGIVPRTLGGLPGIFLGCFVHLSWGHYGWNALGLLLLGPCVLRVAPLDSACDGRGGGSSGVATFAAASAFIALSSGLCVWCMARPAVHAGASGVVCGYVGLLLALTLRRRDVPLTSLLMVLGVVACYGGAALLIRPPAGCAGRECLYGRMSLYEACKSQTTSAEHHTFGFLSGLAAVLFFCQPGHLSTPAT